MEGNMDARQNDNIIDGEYVELKPDQKSEFDMEVDRLLNSGKSINMRVVAELFNMNLSSMKNMIYQLENKKVLSTFNTTVGAPRNFNKDDIYLFKRIIDCMREENKQIPDAIRTVLAQKRGALVEYEDYNAIEDLKQFLESQNKKQLDIIKRLIETSVKAIPEKIENFEKENEELKTQNKELSEKLADKEQAYNEMQTEQLKKILELQTELARTKEELSAEKNKGFFKKLFS